TEFWGLKLKVTPDTLIPRPETELLVEEALKLLKSERSKVPLRSERDIHGDSDGAIEGRAGSPIAIMDIGNGTGCIAIALAKNLPEAKIMATDISKEALKVAKENAEANGVADRIEFVASDIASILPGARLRPTPPNPLSVRSDGMNPILA